MSDIKTLKDAKHWRQLVTSNWLRGADLDPNGDVILTVKSMEYTNPGANKGINESILVIKWVEADYKPYGTTTVENLKALESVYGSEDPNNWIAGQKLALYQKVVKSFGETGPAVRIRTVAPQFVSEDQVLEIEELIVASGSDRAKFLGWAKVAKIEDMPIKTFNKAKQALMAKAAK